MKKALYLLISGIILYGAECRKNRGEEISVLNNSSDAIYYTISFAYPDTTLQNVNSPSSSRLILSDGSDNIETGMSNFELNPVLQIHFIDADTLDAMGWNYVKNNYVVLKRKAVTSDQVIEADYTINYP